MSCGMKDGTKSSFSPTFSGTSSIIDHSLHAGGLWGIMQNVGSGRNGVGVPQCVEEAMRMREMEKSRIREEIIMDGVLRRRELEAEVLAELKMERELVVLRERQRERWSFGNSKSSLVGSNRGQATGGFCNGVGIEQKLSTIDHVYGGGIDEKLSRTNRTEGGASEICPEVGKIEVMRPLVNGMEKADDGSMLSPNAPVSGVTEDLPFQRQQRGVRQSSVKPVIDLSNGILRSRVNALNSLAAGMKRKFETSWEDFYDKIALARKLKNSKTQWSCSLCQVSTTSEQGLQGHFNGKKHKAKERTSEWIRNAAFNPFPKVTEQFTELSVPSASRGSINILAGYQDLKEAAEEKNDEKQELEDLKCTSPASETQSNINFKFWCPKCKFGTNSEASMNVHRQGMEHKALYQKNLGESSV